MVATVLPSPSDEHADWCDPVAVDRAVAGLRVGRPLTWTEAAQAVDRMTDTGRTTVDMARHLGWTEHLVRRFRMRLATYRAASRITGDPLTERLLDVAADLHVAVHAEDADAVADAFTAAEKITGDPLTAARGLAVVLAAAAPETAAPADLVAAHWSNETRAEFARLRGAGVSAVAAATLAGR